MFDYVGMAARMEQRQVSLHRADERRRDWLKQKRAKEMERQKRRRERRQAKEN